MSINLYTLALLSQSVCGSQQFLNCYIFYILMLAVHLNGDHDELLFVYEQGLKRLKKNLNEGRSGQPMDCSKTSDSVYRFIQSTSHKVDSESSTRDRYLKGNGIPISIRYKKLGNEELSKQRDHHKKDWLQQTVEEPSPVEIGPKCLKVRGHSFLGLESRLN